MNQTEIINALQFVKVSTTHSGEQSNIQSSGHLTQASCKLLIVQLERDGFEIVKRR